MTFASCLNGTRHEERVGSMETVVSINGRKVSRDRARLSVFDNSLLYAEGLFETLLAVEDRLIFESLHMKRLQAGARAIGLKLPVSPHTIARWAQYTATCHPSKIKKVRLTVTSGDSARWTGHQGKPQIIVIAAPHAIPKRPFRLLVSPLRVDQESSLRRIKTISYVLQATALKQAIEHGYDDALLLNEKNQIAEVTSANIFWVNRGTVYTPPLSAGCLEGVTRDTILKQAAGLGYPVKESKADLATLASADELFISSSLKLVLAVSEISNGRKRLQFKSGPITAALRRHFLGLAGLR
jgi:branched-subunit amino acid aminotransferase/4-amino-4-deoxychorismate lyase